MKNIKKYIFIMLIFALATPLQLCTMEPIAQQHKQINPYLNAPEKEMLKQRIQMRRVDLRHWADPKSPFFNQSNPKTRKIIENKLKMYEEMYYGNQPYTEEDIVHADLLKY